MNGPTEPSRRVEADALLRIDVAAEIRKLARAQLQGDWQLPTEFVRHAISRGARAIEVTLESDGFSIEAADWRIERAALDDLAALSRATTDPALAHAALARLEAKGAWVWIALGGRADIEVEIVGRSAGGGALHLQRRDGVLELRPHAPPAPERTRVRLRHFEFDRKRARNFALDALRFAPVGVRVDGREPHPAFPASLDVSTLGRGGASMALTWQGELPRVWVLRHGVLAAHFTAARGPAFELVLELGDRCDPRATAGDLRARGEAELDAAMAHFIRRLDDLARRPAPDPDFRSRLTVLALQGMKISNFARELAPVPVFDRYEDDGSSSAASLLDLRAGMVRDGGRKILFALRPRDDPERHDLRARPAVLDDEQRAALQRTLDVDLRTPSLRPDASARGRWLRALKRRVDDLRTALGGWVRGRPQTVADADLTPGERRLAEALRRVLGPERELRICQGRFAPRWRSDALELGRETQLVRRAAARCALDEAWCYPAALALTGGRIDVDRLRGAWRPSVWLRGLSAAPSPVARATQLSAFGGPPPTEH